MLELIIMAASFTPLGAYLVAQHFIDRSTT